MENYRSKFKGDFRWVQEAKKPFFIFICHFDLGAVKGWERRAGLLRNL
jgi:hypothetical protein